MGWGKDLRLFMHIFRETWKWELHVSKSPVKWTKRQKRQYAKSCMRFMKECIIECIMELKERLKK